MQDYFFLLSNSNIKEEKMFINNRTPSISKPINCQITKVRFKKNQQDVLATDKQNTTHADKC